MKFRSCTIALLSAGVLFLSGNALAAGDGADLAKAKGCLGCHDVDKKKVGPAFKEVATKRAGKQAELTAKLKEAKGHPKVTASDAELKTLVDWVLSRK